MKKPYKPPPVERRETDAERAAREIGAMSRETIQRQIAETEAAKKRAWIAYEAAGKRLRALKAEGLRRYLAEPAGEDLQDAGAF